LCLKSLLFQVTNDSLVVHLVLRLILNDIPCIPSERIYYRLTSNNLYRYENAVQNWMIKYKHDQRSELYTAWKLKRLSRRSLKYLIQYLFGLHWWIFELRSQWLKLLSKRCPVKWRVPLFCFILTSRWNSSNMLTISCIK
jgi:hypothetical protein